MNKKILLSSFIIMLIDQITKLIVSRYLILNNSIKIINNFFYLTYVKNFGGAWSILNNNVSFLIIISIIVILLLIAYIRKFKINKRIIFTFGLIYGGICGNLVDRVCLGYVRDFLDFKIFGYDYPIFNIADIAIVVGGILLGIAIIKGEDNLGNNS